MGRELRRLSWLSPRRGLLLAALVLALVIGGGVLLMAPDPVAAPGPPISREGTIRLAPNAEKQCRRLGFDNERGEFRDKGTVECGEAAGPTSQDRMMAIRAWFNRH